MCHCKNICPLAWMCCVHVNTSKRHTWGKCEMLFRCLLWWCWTICRHLAAHDYNLFIVVLIFSHPSSYSCTFHPFQVTKKLLNHFVHNMYMHVCANPMVCMHRIVIFLSVFVNLVVKCRKLLNHQKPPFGEERGLHFCTLQCRYHCNILYCCRLNQGILAFSIDIYCAVHNVLLVLATVISEYVYEVCMERQRQLVIFFVHAISVFEQSVQFVSVGQA